MSGLAVSAPTLRGGSIDTEGVHRRVIDWFRGNRRDLPWRDPNCPAWGVLVSEVMLQQTPVARVLPRWVEWMARWPGSAELAAAPTSEVLRAWSGLGYPRRALRLKETALALVHHHGGTLPRGKAQLAALPGVGDYTASAVAAFAFGTRTVVLDTNVRRVLARVFRGEAGPAGAHLTKPERAFADGLLPTDAAESVEWNVGLMELGALVCTARSPRCGSCPLSENCRWLKAGRPEADTPARRPQAWHGTDRQLRGAVMAILTAGEAEIPRESLLSGEALRGAAELALLPAAQLEALAAYHALEAGGARRERILSGLLADGLVSLTPRGTVTLPG